MKKYSAPIRTVDDYIREQPADLAPMLNQMRKLIRSVVPKAEEVISYQIPVYKLEGMLVGFGTRKQGCSFYVMSTTMPAKYAKKYPGLKYTHSTIHFDAEEKLPAVLIKEIIRERVAQNKERAELKKQTKSGKS